ncbi:hypothetical protein [Reyranella massiliensis]|uniref:hypothetical protein n=1 Tax=Reyranella massiliensis TaxID=445220 RepID=UPI0005C29771|nr:hypothetical protein [Reyranella massiliensis]
MPDITRPDDHRPIGSPAIHRVGDIIQHREYGVGTVHTIDHSPLYRRPRQYVCAFIRSWGLCYFRCWPEDLSPNPSATPEPPKGAPRLRLVDPSPLVA